jgi:hypothetical protein
MKIAVWPCGSWCPTENVEQYSRDVGLGDDYARFTADSEEMAERIALNVQAGRQPLSA